ncbi:MAG: DsbE family thiol:disulfide interchange protein [Pseudomonadota bacterium]
MNMSRFIPAGAFVVLVVFLGIGLTRDPSVLPTEMVDRELPNFDLPELRDPGAQLTRADLIGEVTLLNVFGSWCVACLQEHPTLMQLARDDTVRIAGVNWRDEQSDALDWLQEHGDPYETIIFDSNSDLAIELGVTGAPETFVVDATGRIRYKQIGPITSDVWRGTIRPVLDAIAAEAPLISEPADTALEPLVDATLTASEVTDPDVIAARTEAVSKTLRCVVCQNQSIYDSNAPLALDMKRLVRKRVMAGDDDDQVRSYLQYRYGDFVLMSPPLQLNTLLLWLSPFVLVLGGGLWFLLRSRPDKKQVEDALSEEDLSRIRAALAETDSA